MIDQRMEFDLKRAVLLIRNLRAQGIAQNIDPRMMRIALKYNMMVDDYLNKRHGLTEEADKILTEKARALFNETLRMAKRKDGEIP